MTTTINFNGLAAGTVVDNEYTAQGVTISAIGGSGDAMIFDTDNPTGGDTDLATSNLEEVLIISEDGNSANPDDNGGGGTFNFAFDDEATVKSLTFLDIEETATITLLAADGSVIDTIHVPAVGDNGQAVVAIDVSGVASMDVRLEGSGAIDDLVFDTPAADAGPDYIVEGTSAGELIDTSYTGDPEGDLIDSLDDGGTPPSNDDVVTAGGGNDTVKAGEGDDTVYAGTGDDFVLGDDNNAQEGDDLLLGEEGDDTLCGLDGDDTLDGGAGEDFLEGMEGDDLIFGGTGDDKAYGDNGNDTIFGDQSQSGTQVGDDLITNGSFEIGQADNTFGQADNQPGWYNPGGNGDLETWGQGFQGEVADEGSNFVELDVERGLDSVAQDLTTEDGQDYQLTFSLNQRIEGSDDAVEVYFGGTLVDVIIPGDDWNEYSYSVTGSGSDTLEFREAAENNNTYGPLIDNVSMFAVSHDEEGGNDTLIGGAGEDLIYGNEGDDSIQGNSGDDTLFGDDPAEGTVVSGNLIFNGSFEITSGMTTTGYGFVGEGSAPGWTDSNGGEIDFHNDGRGGINPTDGDNWLDLEASPGNGHIGQDVDGIQDGETYRLTFDAGDKSSEPQSGTGENLIEVYWGGELIAVVDPEAGQMDEYTFEVIGGAGDGSDRLEFVGTGDLDNFGASIDNVELVQLAGTPGEGGDDTLHGGSGADIIDGQGGDDSITGGTGDDTITGGDGADSLSGGDDRDTFIGGNDGDTIDGGTGSTASLDEDDFDVLDLTGEGPFRVINVTDDADGNSISGTVEFLDGAGDPTGETLTFTEIEEIIGDQVNDDPDAVDDTGSGDEDNDITGNVLTNDTDLNGDDLTVIGNTDPANGSVTIDADGNYTYTPDDDFAGEDSFTYTVSDGNGGEDTATVTLTVNPVNDGPVAEDNTFTVTEDDPAGGLEGNVLTNDSDVDGDTIRITEVTNGTDTASVADPFGATGQPMVVAGDNGGIIQINNAGNIYFDANDDFEALAPGETAETSVTYTISDNNGGTDTATVTFTVTGVNDDPDAVDDADTTDFETEVEVNLLANDTDVDNDAADLTVTAASVPTAQGTLTPTGTEGVYTFTPADGFEGTATISYTISDGAGGTDTAVHTVEVGADPTPADGVVDGEEFGEDMGPGYNDDNLPTDGGGDQIDGDDGDDDVIFGNGGDDTINAGQGSDTVSGGTGDDSITGGASDDADVIDGDEGDDTIKGEGGDDTLDGGTGDDSIEGGTGDDSITGGDGSDDVVGGEGNDTIDTSGSDPATDLATPDIPPFIIGGPGDVDPDDDKDTVDGGAGNDSITTGDDADVITGGTGEDTIDGGIDADTIDGGADADSIIGGEGSDSILGGGGDDTIYGGLDSTAPDVLNVADDGFNSPIGPDPVDNNGDDFINGGAGNDLIFGQDDNDTIVGGTGNDTIDGGVDDDSITGGQGEDSIEGGHGQDFIQGNNDDDVISGGRGSDTLEGNAGDDTIIGGSGDSILGGNDADSIDIDQAEVDENGDADTAIYVDGGTNGSDNDTLDLTDFVQHRNLVETVDWDGDSTSGTVEVQNDDGDWVEVTFAEIENLLLPPQAPDLVVDGEETGELMDPLYDDAGQATDGGGDIIDGADGDNDSIRGNGGDDTINAGEGDDTVDGGDDNDSVTGGNGNDIVDGGEGDDTVRGEDGNDTVSGGAGNDSVTGGTGDDVLDGGEGNDSLTGGSGDDTIDGGIGDDTITGSTGADSITDLDGDNEIFSDNPGSFNPDLGTPIGTVTGGFVVVAPDTDPDDNKDTITTGDGNDSIVSGDDADLINAGDGNNTIDAGTDEDTITTGSGNDSIIGGEGDDLINSGAGDDTIDGGVGDPLANLIDEPNPGFFGDPVLDNGDDTINAGAGNDVVNGEDDNDVIDGGTGNDTLDGGIDDDTVLGGEGDDVIIGGQGADSLDGGFGDDTFNVGTFTDPNGTGDYVEGIGDTVVGGEDGDDGDIDVLDLSGSTDFNIVYDDAIDPTGTPGESGKVIYYTDATKTTVKGELVFKEIEDVIPCFTPGAMIATPRGEVPVETLREGDKIITRDNGIQEIRWTGNRTLNRSELAEGNNLKPILIKAGSLGRNLPERDMLVSPQHRVLITGDTPQLYFEESEVLVAAKHLVGKQGVSVMETMRTTYIHFMFDRHEVVLSDGAWTESFQPGDQTLGAMGEETRAEILALFPELATEGGLTDYAAARRSLKAHEAKLLQH